MFSIVPALFSHVTPHEIFARMPVSLAARLLSDLKEHEPRLYKATIESLAKPRKLRPVFIERKPREERHLWMKEALGKRSGEAAAAHLLQIWFVSRHRALLCDFLDGLGIEHDENGTVDQLPQQPERTRIEAVVDGLIPKHGQEIVALYLHAFQALDENGWPVLNEILADDPRLHLGDSTSSESKESSPGVVEQ
jgi:hypothetical protein